MREEHIDRVIEKYRRNLDKRDISKADADRFFDEIKKRVVAELDRPTHIAIIGKTGVGKTSTINALFGTDWEVSHVRAATKDEQVYVYESERGRLKISDLPGFAEDIDTEEQYNKIYLRVLEECDLALLILKADSRDMLEVQRFLRDVVSRSVNRLQDRIVVALNQVDLVHPGNWIARANVPSREQDENIQMILAERVRSVRKVCNIDESRVIAYSATRRFRLVQLFEAMVSATVGEAWVLDAKKKIADYLELVDPIFLQK